MKISEQSYDRLKGILQRDKECISPQLINLVRTDIYQILKGYFDINLSDIKIDYNVKDSGDYIFTIDFLSSGIKHNTYFMN